MRSFAMAVLLCGLGSPTFGGDFYQYFLSVVDTNQFTQPLGALPGLVDTNNTGMKVTNAVLDLSSLKQSGDVSRVSLGMTMQEVLDHWGKPKAGWTRCLHGLITFSYTGVSLGFEGNRLETIHFAPPAKLAGGLSPRSQMGEFVRVVGAPTSQVGSADRGSLTYLSAGANLRLEFSDEELASIYLERTPSRAEPWKRIAGANRRVERTGGSRFARRRMTPQRRLPPVAHPDCSTETHHRFLRIGLNRVYDHD
jgi:hypothetical protein